VGKYSPPTRFRLRFVSYDPTSPSFETQSAQRRNSYGESGDADASINSSGLRPEIPAESGPESEIDGFCLSSSPDKQKKCSSVFSVTLWLKNSVLRAFAGNFVFNGQRA